MAYATINKGSSYFNTITYTGTGSSNSLTGVGFQPDWVWIKQRSGATWHNLYDVLRGTTKALATNDNGADDTRSTGLTAFNSDGFTVGSDNNANGSSNTYVAWNWLANGAGVSNTQGSITSTVSSNTTNKFSIFTYTGTGASVTTVGHGCSSEPKFVIVKNRSSTGAWVTYHTGAQAGLTLPNQASLILNGTNASANPASGGYLSDGYFSNVTSTTITLRDVNNANNVNTNGNNYIGYAFADVKGFSKFGSYTGNGNADGTFVYTGFKPALVLQKTTSTTSDWNIVDNKRSTYNVNNLRLNPNTSSAESTSPNYCDLLSNGFKFRASSSGINGSGETNIYAAFAENPFVLTDGTPVTAR